MNEQRVNVPELTVTELSSALKRTVEETYSYVKVRGEISGYRGPHPSGHAYFALKDEGARIDAIIWKMTFARMRIKPEEGLEVFVTGRLTTYPGRSKYQIVIETLAPAGVGALMALLEERKKKLAAEGLFDAARKQLLPFLPERIGVVTSPTGAVIRDILHRLGDRFPRHVIVWPVRVQGDGCAEEVAAAIIGFNGLPLDGPMRRPDLLIVARGGGSLEDLWSFNDEIVVRAAAASMIPLIAAVGHETDVTLIDFAADKRAPTPSAAAELAVPVRVELWARGDSRAAHRRGAVRAAAATARSREHTTPARAHRQRANPSRPVLARRRPTRPANPARARAPLLRAGRRAKRAGKARGERRPATAARAAGDGQRAPRRGLAGKRRRPSQPHQPAMRARRHAVRAGATRGRFVAAPARDVGRALRAIAQRAFPSRRTRARLRARARSRRPSAAAGGRGQCGHAARYRVFGRPRARGGGRLIRRGGQTASPRREQTTRPPRQRRFESGQPVRSVVRFVKPALLP